MFISKFSVEDWQGNQNNSLIKPAQTWEEIETAIQELDEHRKTLVTLEAKDETHMAIGGGMGRYIVYLTFDNETFHYLINPSKQDGQQNLVVGGQEGTYPTKLCVTLADALNAAKAFAEFGAMEKSVQWESEEAIELVS